MFFKVAPASPRPRLESTRGAQRLAEPSGGGRKLLAHFGAVGKASLPEDRLDPRQIEAAGLYDKKRVLAVDRIVAQRVCKPAKKPLRNVARRRIA